MIILAQLYASLLLSGTLLSGTIALYPKMSYHFPYYAMDE